MSLFRRFSWVFLGLFATSLAASAAAQSMPSVTSPPPAPSAPTAPPTIEPPTLATFAEAAYPEAARAEGKTARVELQITIAPDGTVSDAQVVTPVGDGFDEAALEAARRFVFTPARRNGEAIPARIRYTYVFELREEAQEPEPAVTEPGTESAAESAAVTPGRLEGNVRNEDGDEPLAGAVVELLADDDSVASTVVTDATGVFAFVALAPGLQRVRVSLADHDSIYEEQTVASGEATVITFRMVRTREQDGYRAVARVDPMPREVTRRTIESVELTNVAGTRGDALRVIELLPGVGRPPGLAGLVLIRGAAPGDSQVFLEGMPVPLLYHFGGLTSFFNSRMIDRIDFYPGNFSVRYGRKTGGVIDVGVRDPQSEGYHGVADVNLIDSSLLLEGPIGDRASFAVAARRSYIDFFLGAIPQDAIGITAAPVYYDYQGIFTWRPTSRDRLRIMAYGSGDRFAANLPAPADGNPAVRGNFDLSTYFHRVQADWRHKFDDRNELSVQGAVGYNQTRIGVGELLRLNVRGTAIFARTEFVSRISRAVRFIAGMDIQVLPTRVDFTGPQLGQSEGSPGGGGDGTQVNGNFVQTGYRPAAYLEMNLRPVDPLQVQVGVRLDYTREITRWNVDPRVSARYTIDEHWTVKAGIGQFSQPPDFAETARTLGNPRLLPITSIHASAGVEHNFDDTYSIGTEGFYKWLEDRVVSNPTGLDPTFTNAGIGRIYGLEVSARARPRGRLFGFLSYTLMRSERRDTPQSDWRLFDFDQTHIFTLSAAYRLGRGWEVGGTFRVVSGNPNTPIVGNAYDARSDSYIPIYGAINSARSGTFHRLDLRIEKTWTFDLWKLALYLDVQNVYNQRNPEGTSYNFDYRQNSVIGGLPVIPSLGLRGEI
jgi:TonB family protein